MKIENNIKQLAAEHECIIVPGFGAFVINPNVSVLKNNGTKLVPPHKRFTFNHHLTHDDGLLTGKHSEVNGISYSEAKEEVLEWSNKIKEELIVNGFYELTGIGIFSLKQNKILFNPFDLFIERNDTFGLKPILVSKVEAIGKTVPTVEHENFQKRIIQLEENIKRLQTEKNNAKKMTSAWQIAASIIPIAVLTGFLLAKLIPSGVNHQQMASVFDTTAIKNIVVTDKNIDQALTQNKQSSLVPTKTDEEIEVKTNETIIEETDAIKTELEKEITSIKSYILISGVFSSKRNAMKKVNQYANQGINASFFSYKNNFAISLGNFNNKEDAKSNLEYLKDNNIKAWIYSPKN